MMINGIDYDAREAQLTAAGIDPDGPETQFGTATVYCSQHKNPHLTAHSSCTVDLLEKFPLDAATYDEALAECRTKGYRLDGEPFPCENCGQVVKEDTDNPRLHRLVSIEDGSVVCPDVTPTIYNGTGHRFPLGMIPVWRG